ncbi:MAG: OmpA family protein [Kangiellaceae bacterium]|jgi:outer membrane protein OmpA-like peptidoglycan-associated protein|nr:OmpA family protein [Kangiellaceae bacterium]
MKKAIVVSTLILSALSQSSNVAAKAASTEKNVGIASGAAVGASLGGPVGFIIGMAVGGLLGEKVEDANQVDSLKQELVIAQQSASDLQVKLDQIAESQASGDRQAFVSTSSMLQIDVLFETNQTSLDQQDLKRIKQLANFMSRYPTLAIKLDGFADPRGLKQENIVLSEQRVTTVKNELVKLGINSERIFTKAHGESQSTAAKDNLDAYALERRVSMQFVTQADESFASNQ